MTQGTGALGDLRVVEIGSGFAAAYAAKLLADLGADVVKVESPSGDATRALGPFPGGRADPEASGLFVYLNTNKRSVVLDFDSREDRARLGALLDRSDLLVHDVPPANLAELGLEPDRVLDERPRLVATSISPFGLSGPYRDYKAHDLNVWCAGGVAYLNGAGPGSDDLPPLRAFGHQAAFQAGLNAAVASLGALHAREALGRGQHVEVSAQECLVTILETSYSWWTYRGLTASRLGRKTIQPVEFFPCRDGWIYLCMVEEHQWRAFVDVLGNPEWAELEVFADRFRRGANWDALKPMIAEWLAGQTVRELYERLQSRRIPIAPVSTVGDLLASRHLNARDFFVSLAQPRLGEVRVPGAPYLFSRTPWRLRLPAPTLGQHTTEVFRERSSRIPSPRRTTAAPKKPLAGIRVADFTWVWAGPYATELLAHLGAEVIRVESAKRLCVTRLAPPFADSIPGPNRSGYFNQYNQAKRSIVVDLKDPRGLDVARRLVAASDVVAENFANGVMDRLGLGYDECRRLREDVIMLSISGYGRSGPEQDFVSYGPATVPLAGFSAVTGYRGGPPMHIGMSYGDPTAGLHGALAVLAALHHRRRTGEGQAIDVSLWEATATLLPEALLEPQLSGTEPARDGNRHRRMAPHGIFRARGADRWVSIAVATDDEWRALARAIGAAGLDGDPRFATLAARKANEDELENVVERWTRTLSAEDATRRLQAAGVAAFPCMTSRDLAEDPHLEARRFFSDVPHPEVGARKHVGVPWRLGATPCRVDAPAPRLGEHTREVLAHVLGYEEDEIDALAAEGVIEATA